MASTLYPAETSDGTVTSFIPLTTTWTASAGCESKYRLNGPSLMAFDPGYGLDVETNVICAPPAVTTWWEQGLLGDEGWHATAVSIGPLVCPAGWTTVAASTQDTSSTAAMCCPPGYYLENGIAGEITGECLSDVSSGMTLTYGSTSADDSTSWSMATTTMESSSTVGAIAVVGLNIHFSRTPTSTPMTVTLPSPTTGTSQTSTSTSNPGDGLSSGAKAGIGVGVAVGAIGVIALVVAIFLFRRRKEKSPDGPAPPYDPQAPDQPPYQPSVVDRSFYGPSSSGPRSAIGSAAGQPSSTDQTSYNNTYSTARHSVSNTVLSSTQNSQSISRPAMSEAGWQEQSNWPAELDGARHGSPVELSST